MTHTVNGALVDPTEVPEWLRTLVERASELTPSSLGWPRNNPPAHARRAAVLILLGDSAYDAGPDVLLLRRAEGLDAHPGQVAFPGGGLDPIDGGPVDAAIREAVEETGVVPSGIRPVATLPELHVPNSGFRVTPVIAHWREPSPVLAVDPGETAAVARVPVRWLTDPQNRITVSIGRHTTPAFLVPGMLVWGFTGGLLSGVLDLGGWSRGWNQHDVRELDAAFRAAEEADDVGFAG